MKVLYAIISAIKKVSFIAKKVVKILGVAIKIFTLFIKKNVFNRDGFDTIKKEAITKNILEGYLNKIHINIDNLVDNNCIMVTSPKRFEGKTTLCINIAKYLAEIGKKTLLVDCDMRDPKIGDVFKINDNPGMSDLLKRDIPWRQVVMPIGRKNLYVLGAGSPVTSPVVLLNQDSLSLLLKDIAEEFDYVIVDTPSVLLAPDTMILAQQGLDILMVIRHQFTQQSDLYRAIEALELVDASIKGMVYNDLPLGRKEYKSLYPLGVYNR